jgi:NADP-dependent 3-hydroxy acid dehydrogenase YdfG
MKLQKWWKIKVKIFLFASAILGDGRCKKERGVFFSEFKGVEVMVNSAGTNVPQRSFDCLSIEDYQKMIDVNLNGAFIGRIAFFHLCENDVQAQ